MQRDRPIHLWGWADPDEQISATLNDTTQTANADALGHWSLYLPPQPAGGPFQIVVTGRNKIVLDDILIGDVWFASGQSNMEMPLNGFPGSAALKNGAEEIQQANHPNLRLLLVPNKASSFPLQDFDGNISWAVCSPESAAKFSAVAYFFGREVSAKENVPVGLIDSSWGGTPGEAWVSLDSLSADASLMPVFATWAQMADSQADIPAMLAAEKREDETARRNNAPAPKHSWHPNPASYAPSWLFNGMVAPAVPFGIKGVIWYQGETNSKLNRAPHYEKVFTTLISDWRRQWREGDFPFLYVQISSFRSDATEEWPIVREAQRRALSLVNTGMAVTLDVGDPDNVHPPDKQTVGARLALAARAVAYHEDVPYSGPIFRATSLEPGAVRVWFDHIDGGLVAHSDSLKDFEVAGDDHRFVPASAHIDGASVVVSAPELQHPRYVRYGWQNAPPSVDLYNGAGLPASPFTSEPEMPAPHIE